MASLDRTLRKDLENAVKKARRVAEAGARDAINQLAVGHHEPWPTLSPEQRKLRNSLRAHGRQLGDKLDDRKGTQTIDRLTGECAYEHWHRLLFARFLAENDLLVEPESGMSLSLDECRELAREQGKDWLVLASYFAQRMLPQIFRAGDPVLEVALPPEKRQELEAILEGLLSDVFIADDSLGWVYQYWQADLKEAVNASENKIGADELPAVTQLFTEDYMVLFLLHNTLGSWWAGKVLAAKPDLARSAASEEDCRAACAVHGIEWSYLRFVREGDMWRPATNTFRGWPSAAKDLTVLDPCMGSGHFLAFALPMLVALRREEEKLSVAEAIDAVLRDNLFGLELDPRCTQIAAFNVGFTAWKLAGYRPLPALNLACAGLAINSPVATWTELARGNALAENAMKQLYDVFRQAPTLGSLIDPTRIGGELFVAHFERVRSLLSVALASETSEESELAVVAQGIARAAAMLADRYTLVVTNVPYLGRGKQGDVLKDYCTRVYPQSKADLATCFVERCLEFCAPGGSTALVTPQNWIFLGTYKKLRARLLENATWNVVVRLGPAAFEDMNWWASNTGLFVISNSRSLADSTLAGIDVSAPHDPKEKAGILGSVPLLVLSQVAQASNPDCAIVFGDSGGSRTRIADYAEVLQGVSTTDMPRFVARFWELPSIVLNWEPFQMAPDSTGVAGMCGVLRWEQGHGALARIGTAQKGIKAKDRRGLGVAVTGKLHRTRFLGTRFDGTVAVIVPHNPAHLLPLTSFVLSSEFIDAVRELDQALSVTEASFAKAPFDLAEWERVGAEEYPVGLPHPESNDPTQWLFDGQPSTTNCPLQVAVARLLGYRWPRQTGSSFMDCPALDPDAFEPHADEDGIVCLPSLRGEAPATERLRALLADASGGDWSAQKLNELLADASFAGTSLEDWLRDRFFEQHCVLFHQRPFVWQIWDGRRDGFSALVNYHQLAASNGEGRRILDKLTHTYLGDWLDRQRADQKAGVEGADGRVAAAEHLKRELEKILEGEPPYDIFVRWKPLHQQPIGWEPDIDDGVRVNIRPFTIARPLNARGKNACILRVVPKIKWDKDRGKEPLREKADFPWFWGWDEITPDFKGAAEFDGNRWNDLHYSRAAKLAARERAKGSKS